MPTVSPTPPTTALRQAFGWGGGGRVAVLADGLPDGLAVLLEAAHVAEQAGAELLVLLTPAYDPAVLGLASSGLGLAVLPSLCDDEDSRTPAPALKLLAPNLRTEVIAIRHGGVRAAVAIAAGRHVSLLLVPSSRARGLRWGVRRRARRADLQILVLPM